MSSVVPQTPFNEYTGNGVATVYPYEFQLLAASDLIVTIDDVVIPSSDFILTNVGVQAGGEVIFTIPPANLTHVVLSRVIVLQRDTDYQYNGDLKEDTLDNDFNRIWQALQGHGSQIGSALRAPYPEQFDELPGPAARANKVLAFDVDGVPLLSVPVSGSAADLAILLANTGNPANGDALIGVKSPLGASTVATTQHQVNLREAHIKDWGAVAGASAAANNAAIQTAINEVFASSRTVLNLGDYGDFAVTGLTIPASAQSVEIRGGGARLVTTTNAPVFTVTTSDNVIFNGARIFGNAGAVSNSQFGIYLNGIGRGRVVNCHLEGLSAGVWANNANVGYITGGFQVPSEISGNIIKDCYNGIYTQDDGLAAYGEYMRVSNNTITDCLNWGINSHAGNTSIVNNTVNGNYGGVLIYSIGTANGDHGMVVGNTINHNLRCGLYATTLLRSLLVANNNIWATLGDGTANGNLGPGNQASSFGAYFFACKNVTCTGNVFGRNKKQVAFEGWDTSVFSHNVLTTDPANTVQQLVDVSVITGPRFNAWGPNVFNGTWTGGGTDGNPNARQTPTLVNAWVNFGVPFKTASYWRDEQNVVHLEGLIKTGVSGTVAFNLPLEYRPVATVQFPTVANGLFGFVSITAAGDVTVSGASANLSLDGISFLAL